MAIPNNTITNHHIGEVKAEFKAGILAEDFPHIANLLINLYGDPITAVEREYANNALDAHIAAGNPDPILVTLPSHANPEFIVQDYGVGLSVDDLENTYSMYGRSTKRGTNAETGQLGLGCKSGLTYAEAFTITAVKNGVKVVAQSTKDEHGVGTIKVLDTMATDEPNGVRIAIPVKTYDIDAFRTKAERLFQFWEPGTVLINGKAPEVPEWRKQALVLDDDTFVVPGDCGLNSSYVIMGNVPYPIPDIRIEARHTTVYRRVVARINMGDVDFIPSREHIHDTDHTKACLDELSNYVTTRFDEVLAGRLAEAPTRWDETMMKVLWKGSGVRVNASHDMPIWSYDPDGWQRKARAHISYQYSMLTNTKVVVVTGYPNKTLSGSHRTRLRDFASDCRQFIVVPKGCDISGIDGRENTFTWDEVLDKTTDTVLDTKTGKRVKRDETKYDILGGKPLTAGEIAALPGLKLLMHRNDSARYGDYGATVVEMYSSNQEARLRRLIPGIRAYKAHVNEAAAAAKAAITEQDKRIVAARNLQAPFTKLDPSEVDDPTLATAIRLSKLPNTDTIAEAIKYKINIPAPAGGVDINEYTTKAYPLINNRNYYYGSELSEDVLFYINAKFAVVSSSLPEEGPAVESIR